MLVPTSTAQTLAHPYLLALGDSVGGFNAELDAEVLETIELISDAELDEMTFELLVVAGSSLAGGLFLVPLLSLYETVELVVDTATRVVVEVREAIEVGGKDKGHLC